MKTSSLFRALVPAATVVLGSTALAQTFTNLPAGSGVATAGGGLSSNGLWATGSDANGAYLWDSTNPLVVTSLGEGQGTAVSDDGTRVLGKMTEPGGLKGLGIYDSTIPGWIWTDPFAYYSPCSPNDTASPYDMSNDGMIATGLGWIACKGRAINYDANLAVSMGELPQTTTNSGRGNCVSGDGTWLGGWERVGGSTDVACIWKPDGLGGFTQVFPLITGTDPNGYGSTWGLSTNGEWACGEQTFSGQAPWVYNTTTAQLTFLGPLPTTNPSDAHIAKAISDDGQTVVGLSGNSFFGSPWRAWVWTPSGGIVQMDTWLASKGVPVPPNPLYGAFDLSADGRTIYGANGTPFGFPGDGFVATLKDPVVDLGGSSAGTGGKHPMLTSDGTYNPGTSFSLSLDNAAGSAISVLIVSGSTTAVPLFGGTLYAFPLDYTQVILTDINGEWDVSATWPPNLASGASLTFQDAVFDPVAVGSFALSNALEITTP